MSSDSKEACFEYVNEYDVNLKVNKHSFTPRKNEAYYCREMDIIRSVISTALSVFIDSGESVFSPPRCLDGIGASGVSGLIWKKYFLDSIDVIINDPNELSYQIIRENVKTNNLPIEVLKKDPCVLLHETPYSFIYLDCHTNAHLYLDSVFRNIPKKGIFALTTKDDCSLYGRAPEIALRNYGGVITKTFYYKELAVRLMIAGIVRSAARHNKGIRILCVLSIKSFITILVQILKGPSQANSSVDNVRRLVHCNMCEDRSFFSSTIYPLENPSKLLSCGCQAQTPGKVTLELGPVWCGSLFDTNFIKSMMIHLKKFPWKESLSEILRNIFLEAWCPDVQCEKQLTCFFPPQKSQAMIDGDKKDESELPPAKKLKSELSSEEDGSLQPHPEPPFFFNLHRHCPKGPSMAKLEEVVSGLRSAGFRASRTHFDPVAVRTNAALSDLQKVMSQKCK